MNRVKKDVIRARFNNSKQIVAFENINTIRVDKLEDRLALYYEYKPKLKIEEIRIQQDFRNEMELDPGLKGADCECRKRSGRDA